MQFQKWKKNKMIWKGLKIRRNKIFKPFFHDNPLKVVYLHIEKDCVMMKK